MPSSLALAQDQVSRPQSCTLSRVGSIPPFQLPAGAPEGGGVSPTAQEARLSRPLPFELCSGDQGHPWVSSTADLLDKVTHILIETQPVRTSDTETGPVDEKV